MQLVPWDFAFDESNAHINTLIRMNARLAMLTWCLGGWMLPRAFHRAEYLLHIPFTKGHERAPQPYNLFGVITITMLASILGAVCNAVQRCPWTWHFDEVGIKPRLYVATSSKTEPPQTIALCERAGGKLPYKALHSICAVLADLASTHCWLSIFEQAAPFTKKC